MTSFIAACGSGRSISFIPAVPAAWSVTTIAFMMIFSSVICVFGGNVAALESPFDISCQGPWVLERRALWSRGGQGLVLGIDDENREQLCGLGRACVAADAMAGTGCLVPTLAGVVDPLRLIVDL